MRDQVSLPFFVARVNPSLAQRGIEALMKAFQFISQIFRDFNRVLVTVFVRFATLPYYRLYHFNTRDPLQKIAVLASEPSSSDTKLLRAISSWRQRKLSELQFITLSCTVLAAAVIGAFSWNTVDDAYWLTHGFWHSSLILAVLGILLSASEVTVLHLLGPLPRPRQSSSSSHVIERYMPLLLSKKDGNGNHHYIPRKKMVFTWQGPLMLMSYSVCGFLAGLTILVCTPFIKYGRKWSTGHNIATMYLTVLTIGLTAFVFCSFWVYHYVDLKFEVEHEDESHNEDSKTSNVLALPNMLVPPMANAASTESSYHPSFRAIGNSSIGGEQLYRKNTV